MRMILSKLYQSTSPCILQDNTDPKYYLAKKKIKIFSYFVNNEISETVILKHFKKQTSLLNLIKKMNELLN